MADFFTDAAAGTLPGYSLLEPDYTNQSEENPQNIVVGEEFTASVTNALINGPDGFHRYGFRVPFALISPWARRDFVSHQVDDHTSILKLIETKWNLPALTYRDANAAPMLDMLDLRRPSFAEPPMLAQPLAVTDPSSLSCSVTGPGTIPPAGSVTADK